MADAKKRGRNDGSSPSVNGGSKKQRPETDSTGGSKTKPCTKFFSTSGCPFGESCHFLHHVPGGYHVVAQMMNLQPMYPSAPPMYPGAPPMYPGPPPPVPNDPSHGVKTRLCTKFNSPEGCKYGNMCRYAHGEWELNRPVPPYYDPRAMPPHMQPYYGHRPEPPMPGVGPGAGFGAPATTKISIDASLTSSIQSGVNSKQISRKTGAKISIKDHESDPKLKNIEVRGTFDQIKTASAMVRDLVASVSSGAHVRQPREPRICSANTFKTKLCEKFASGSCTYGEKCNFAHGEAELRKPGA